MALKSAYMHCDHLATELCPGDLIEFSRAYTSGSTNAGLYKHWAVYQKLLDGKHYVIHYSTGGDNGKLEVKSDLLSAAAKDSKCRKNNSEDYRSGYFVPKEIVRRAESRIGSTMYSVRFNNCEHFAHWCRYGTKKSKQAVPAVHATVLLGSIVNGAGWAGGAAGSAFLLSLHGIILPLMPLVPIAAASGVLVMAVLGTAVLWRDRPYEPNQDLLCEDEEDKDSSFDEGEIAEESDDHDISHEDMVDIVKGIRIDYHCAGFEDVGLVPLKSRSKPLLIGEYVHYSGVSDEPKFKISLFNSELEPLYTLEVRIDQRKFVQRLLTNNGLKTVESKTFSLEIDVQFDIVLINKSHRIEVYVNGELIDVLGENVDHPEASYRYIRLDGDVLLFEQCMGPNMFESEPYFVHCSRNCQPSENADSSASRSPSLPLWKNILERTKKRMKKNTQH